MRFLPALLAKIFPAVPLPPASTTMDVQTSDHCLDDPITRAINAAVSEHELTAAGIRDDYGARLRDTMDELFERIGQRHDDPNV